MNLTLVNEVITSGLRLGQFLGIYMGVSQKNGYPQIIHLFIGFSIIFTIHFGAFPPFFGNTHIYIYIYV